MKIGIFTYSFANNYGACLQAYALCKFLCMEGYNAELINYVTDTQIKNNSIFRQVTSFKEVIKNLSRLIHKREIEKRLEKFQDFRHKYHNTGDKICEGNLEAVKKTYDIIIVGSDQVWNPNVEDFDDIFFIDFFNNPKIAYAVSLGNATYTMLVEYKEAINKFHAVSVRERSSEHLLKKLTGQQNIITVVDPIFLISSNEWDNIANDTTKKISLNNYIVCYYLRRKGSIKFQNNVRRFAKKNKLDVLFINSNYGLASWGKDVVNDASPTEFLGLISQAKVVFTNSFHATAFSIIFKKNFYFINDNIKNDNRIRDLFCMLKIRDRIVDNFDFSKVSDKPLILDNSELDKQTFKSKEWILNNLTQFLNI